MLNNADRPERPAALPQQVTGMALNACSPAVDAGDPVPAMTQADSWS